MDNGAADSELEGLGATFGDGVSSTTTVAGTLGGGAAGRTVADALGSINGSVLRNIETR